jgi:peptide deformylase
MPIWHFFFIDMIKNIIKDVEFLKKPSSNLSKDDLFIAEDLKDTLSFHRKNCVGMAANMIGYSKNIFIFINEKEEMEIMIHPVILKKEGEYQTEEGCLSLTGVRKCIRDKKIIVEYMTLDFKKRIKTYTGFTAEIIEHEMDHLQGIII